MPQFRTQAVEACLSPPPASLRAEPDRWFNNTGCLVNLMAAEPAEIHTTPLLWLQGPGLRFQQDPWTAVIWSLMSGPLDPNGTQLNSVELSGLWQVGRISQLRCPISLQLSLGVSRRRPLDQKAGGSGLSQGCACL